MQSASAISFKKLCASLFIGKHNTVISIEKRSGVGLKWQLQRIYRELGNYYRFLCETVTRSKALFYYFSHLSSLVLRSMENLILIPYNSSIFCAMIMFFILLIYIVEFASQTCIVSNVLSLLHDDGSFSSNRVIPL